MPYTFCSMWERSPWIQPPIPISFFPGPQTPIRTQSVKVPKEPGNLRAPHYRNRGQGAERGRDLPEVTQQTNQDLGPRGSASSFNRRHPPLPHLRGKGGETPGPGGKTACGLGACPPAFPTGELLWAPPNSGHPSKDDVSRAGNWAGPRKSPSGRQIPTGLEASGAGASFPDSSTPGPLVPSICPPGRKTEAQRRMDLQSHIARRQQAEN